MVKRVKIKNWEELVDEFGLDENGNINVSCGFSQLLDSLIPEDREILVTDEGNYCLKWYRTNHYNGLYSFDIPRESVAKEIKNLYQW